MTNNQAKYNTVIYRNTFFYFDDEFEENYEKYIFSIKETIIYLKNEVHNSGCTKSVFECFLEEKGIKGLKALLAITGISNESLKRLITTLRIINNEELNKLLYRENWESYNSDGEIVEWATERIYKLVSENVYFRKCLVNLFFEGSTNELINKLLPTFELKKFSLEKLSFDMNAMIDTLARYKEKGSRAALKGNNPEIIISRLLEKLEVPFEVGDLSELVKNENIKKRTMDFIIPDKRNPMIIIESSYLMTTSSGQGDKSKTEISIKGLIKKHYPQAKFIGFIDGIGWYVRKEDLKRMVSAYEDVFTFHPEEMSRFSAFVKDILNDR